MDTEVSAGGFRAPSAPPNPPVEHPDSPLDSPLETPGRTRGESDLATPFFPNVFGPVTTSLDSCARLRPGSRSFHSSAPTTNMHTIGATRWLDPRCNDASLSSPRPEGPLKKTKNSFFPRSSSTIHTQSPRTKRIEA